MCFILSSGIIWFLYLAKLEKKKDENITPVLNTKNIEFFLSRRNLLRIIGNMIQTILFYISEKKYTLSYQ